MYRHILVPIDGSVLGARLVTQAVRFAAAMEAEITFFSMREDYGASEEGALARTLSPAHFAEQALGETNALLAKALAAAGEAGVRCDALARTGRHPYQEILAAAAECGCDLIFMASHGRKWLKSMMIGSQTQKVLAHSSLPVLVATVEANTVCSAAETAVSIIKDEHRAIAAICSGLREQAARGRKSEQMELGFVASMLCYLRDFPERLHHPKEEEYLFSRLKRRHPPAGELITMLEAEHDEGGQELTRLEAEVARMQESGAETQAHAALAVAIEQYIDMQWTHLNHEEKMIIPLALEHLAVEDWAEIEQAFVANEKIGRHSEDADAYHALFSRLMNIRSRRQE